MNDVFVYSVDVRNEIQTYCLPLKESLFIPSPYVKLLLGSLTSWRNSSSLFNGRSSIAKDHLNWKRILHPRLDNFTFRRRLSAERSTDPRQEAYECPHSPTEPGRPPAAFLCCPTPRFWTPPRCPSSSELAEKTQYPESTVSTMYKIGQWLHLIRPNYRLRLNVVLKGSEYWGMSSLWC